MFVIMLLCSNSKERGAMSIADDDEAAKGLMSGPQAATIECERTGSTSSACASGNLPVVPSLCDIPPFKTNAQILSELAAKVSNTRDRTVTDAVAHSFGASKDELVSWTKTITATRNICAHFEPLFVRKQLPAQPKAIRGLQCPRRSPLFAVLLLAHLLRKTIKTYDRNLDYKSRIEHDAAQEIAALLEYFGNVPIPGIPFNWRTLLNAQ